MFDEYSDYTIRLSGYKMELLLESLKYYESEYPSFEVQNLINEVSNSYFWRQKKENEV